MLFEVTLPAGTNFDGLPGTGEVDFSTFAPVSGNDNDRIKVLTFAIAIGQADGNARLKDVYVAFAETLADAQISGNGWIFHATSDVHEFVSVDPVILLPNWNGYVFATESSGTFVKSFQLDWIRTNLATTEAGIIGGSGGGC